MEWIKSGDKGSEFISCGLAEMIDVFKVYGWWVSRFDLNPECQPGEAVVLVVWFFECDEDEFWLIRGEIVLVQDDREWFERWV